MTTFVTPREVEQRREIVRARTRHARGIDVPHRRRTLDLGALVEVQGLPLRVLSSVDGDRGRSTLPLCCFSNIIVPQLHLTHYAARTTHSSMANVESPRAINPMTSSD